MNFLPQERQAELRALAQKQQKSYRQMLMANKNKVFSIQIMRRLHRQIDEITDDVRERPDVQFDCKPGCSYCCHFRIEVFAPEVFVLARRLRTLPADRLDSLIQQLEAHAADAQGIRREDFSMKCPLLVDNMCSVYEDRPSICRKYLSLDVEECKKPGVSAPEDGELVFKSLALISGTKEAFAKAKISLTVHELGQALLIALKDDTCETRWFKGETVFPLIPEAM